MAKGEKRQKRVSSAVGSLLCAIQASARDPAEALK